MSDRFTQRLKIKQTVERVVPMMDIDTTKVLTDAEIAELHRQTENRVKAVRLAREVGRAGLRDRLNKTMLKVEEIEDDLEEQDS